MQIGMIGLGRMGGNMARRLLRAGCEVAGYDQSAEARATLAAEGLRAADSLVSLVTQLPAPRVIWLMVPAGAATDATLATLLEHLQSGDTVVDGGNAYYRDSQRRAAEMRDRAVHFIDCGVSGGVWGLANGYALMFGGPPEAAQAIAPFARASNPSSAT